MLPLFVCAFLCGFFSSFVGVQAWFWDPKVDTPLGTVEGFTDGNVFEHLACFASLLRPPFARVLG